MKRILACAASWMIFMMRFTFDIFIFAGVFCRMIWRSFWFNMIDYHNRVQHMCDGGKDVFSKKENHANI